MLDGGDMSAEFGISEGSGGRMSHAAGEVSPESLAREMHGQRELGGLFKKKEDKEEKKRSLSEVMVDLNRINNNPRYVTEDPGRKGSVADRKMYEAFKALKAEQMAIYARVEKHPSLVALKEGIRFIQNSANNDMVDALTTLRRQIEPRQREEMENFSERGLVSAYVGDVERMMELSLAQRLENIAQTDPKHADGLEKVLKKKRIVVNRNQVSSLDRAHKILGFGDPKAEIADDLDRMAKITLNNLSDEVPDEPVPVIVPPAPPAAPDGGSGVNPIESIWNVKPEKRFLDAMDSIASRDVNLSDLAGYDENGAGSILIGKGALDVAQSMYFEEQAASYLRKNPGALNAVMRYWRKFNEVSNGGQSDRFKKNLSDSDQQIMNEAGCTLEEASRARAIMIVSGFPQGVSKLGTFLTNYPGLWGKDGAIKSKFHEIKSGGKTLAELLDKGDAAGFVKGLEQASPNACQKEWNRVGAVRSLTNTLAEMLRNIGGQRNPLVVMREMNAKLTEQYVKRNVDKNDVQFILEALHLKSVTKIDGNRLMLFMGGLFPESVFNRARDVIKSKERN